MARINGSSNGPSKAPKKKKPAPARKPAAKKAAPKTKGAKAIPGYKVPKKLLKNTKSNRDAARPSLAQTMAKSEKAIAAFNAGKPNPTMAATKPSVSTGVAKSDWDKGIDVEHAIAARKKKQKKLIDSMK